MKCESEGCNNDDWDCGICLQCGIEIGAFKLNKDYTENDLK